LGSGVHDIGSATLHEVWSFLVEAAHLSPSKTVRSERKTSSELAVLADA
jgi:hypothetical protein